LETFQPGEKISVIGTSKGKGFQGVVKRHGFAGTKASHGNKDQLRASGSIGSTGPQKVFKGLRMAGRMGGDQITVNNLEIVKIDLDNNEIM
jgi:large subunit ribosomal protein L3